MRSPSPPSPPLPLVCAVAFAAGDLAGLARPAPPWALACAAIALVSLGVASEARRRRLALALLVAGFGLAGAARGAAAPTAAELASPLAPWMDRPVTVLGRVVGLPARGARGVSVALEVEALRDAEGSHPVALRLRAMLPPEVPDARLEPGRLLMLRGVPRPLSGPANPGAPDTRGAMLAQGLVATLRVDDAVWVVALEDGPGAQGPAARVARLRWRAVGEIRSAVPGLHGALMAALLVGDRSGIDEAWRDRFARTGTAHLLAISGLHVGLVGLAALRGMRALLAAAPGLVERGRVPVLAALGALVPVVAYVALAGARAPALRAGVAVALVLLAISLDRRPSAANAMAAALAGLVAADPRAVTAPSLALSFTATAAVLLAVARRADAEPPRDAVARLARWIGATARVTAAASAATAPLVAHAFGQIPLVGLIANPLVVPLVAMGTVPIAGIALALLPIAPAVGRALLALAELPLAAALAVIEGLARLPGGVLEPAAGPALLAALGSAAVLVALATRAPARIAAGLLAIGCVGAPALTARLPPAEPRLTFLAVGRGSSTLIELPGGGTMLVDVGGAGPDGFDAGRRVVVPALAALGIRRLDRVALTHGHADHVGGLPAVLDALPVGEVWLPPGIRLAPPLWAALRGAEERGTALRWVARGDRVRARGGVELRVLHPPVGLEEGARSENERSLVLQIRHGGGRALLTGDVTAAAERSLLASGAVLESALLEVPHHGSRGSSSPAFLAAVRPRLAVVSAARASRHHPSGVVLERLAALGAEARVTGRSGAQTVHLDADGRLRARSFRRAIDGREEPLLISAICPSCKRLKSF